MTKDIDYLGAEWGKWMRYQPNGWYRKNHIANLEKSLVGSGNNYACAAVTSDSLNTLGQQTYHPQKLEKKLRLGADTWQISASGASADVYGQLRKNPGGGRINNIRYYRSKILIRRFMPEDVLPFHRAWKELGECHQAMLWAHHVLDVAPKRKVDLLQTTNELYPKWLDLSQKKIAREIDRLDAENRYKKNGRTTRPVIDCGKCIKGPLWSCRILASIHKFPIRYSGAPTDIPPICDDIIFRRPNGEIYTVISNIEYGRLRRQGRANAFLAEQRGSGSDRTYCHFDDWFPSKECFPVFRGKTTPSYNAPSWVEKKELTRLDVGAADWAKELLDSKEYSWRRGGDNAWYL